MNSYGKVFPTQPPSGTSVREARGLAGPYRPHLDEATPDIEAPPERKKHLGESQIVSANMLLSMLTTLDLG